MKKTITMLFAIATCVPLSSVAQSTPSLCPAPNPQNAICSIDDTFMSFDKLSPTYLNQRLWSLEAGIQPGVDGKDPTGSVVSMPTELKITMPGGSAGRGIVSVCSATGDFDVQVDYKLITWPPHNPYGLRLGAIDLGAC